MKTVSDIRSAFLAYFDRHGHEVVASSALVPSNDPTLMFTNSGMVQFKNVFTGGERRAIPRAVTAQKCVRAGGKHNDLENVGHTARHHTFFEMLGNFSFGDYFKEQAVFHSWELITDIYGLPKERLLVSVYHDDEEAVHWWKKIAGLGDDRIIRIATSDNFWSMGDVGPCGPCSEIFYDHGEAIAGGPPGSADEDGDRFIEIWNLVFMQFEQQAGGTRIDLPKPSIDTGMGLERIAAVMQGKHDNYDTDLMRILIESSAEAAGVAADGEHKIAHRVIADHLRASAFLIADGVLPSNEGRGYVLRRIMRRAMRHAHQMGCAEPMMYRLVPTLISAMGEHYGELVQCRDLITSTLEMEEGRFKETLGRGLKILTAEVEAVGKNSNKANVNKEGSNKDNSNKENSNDAPTLDGAIAFKLYDTYGFPLDLTQDVMRGEGWSVDTDGFNQAMEQQKAKARRAWAGSGDSAIAPVFLTLSDRLGATEFLGYDKTEAEAVITALIAGDAEITPTEITYAKHGDAVAIITNQTPFYAESGGQLGDTGVMKSASTGDTILAQITDTWKTPSGLFVHKAVVEGEGIAVNDSVTLTVDSARRDLLAANHSATHLMHEALRQTLGAHVQQKGSMVAADRLRFDFSHNSAVTAKEIDTVEAIVNARICANSPVTTRLMTPDAAVAEGAIALFGEKYGNEVRVISMGGEAESAGRSAWSVELCGGTHVGRTGDIGLFKITGESAVAGGIRRIEGVSRDGAMAWFNGKIAVLEAAAARLKCPPELLAERVESLLAERRGAEQVIKNLRKSLAEGGGGGASIPLKLAGSDGEFEVFFASRILDDTPAKELKGIAEAMLKGKERTIAAVISRVDGSRDGGGGSVSVGGGGSRDGESSRGGGKASLVVAVSPDLTGRINAVDLVRVGAEALGGKGGGGRADMAQAGGPNANAAEEAMKAMIDSLGG